jgi:hypothetical protein
MDKAEQILEKHINENDLNFIFHEKKDLWQELLNATNEALGLAHVSDSRQGEICQICYGELDADYGSVCSNCNDTHLDD